MKLMKNRTRRKAHKRSRRIDKSVFLVSMTLVMCILLQYASEFIPDMMRGHNPKIVEAKTKDMSEDNDKEGIKKIDPNELGQIASTAIANITEKMNLLEIKPVTRSEFNWRQKLKDAAQLRMKANVVCDPSDITKISNLTPAQMKETFKGTWLEGKEDWLYQLEHQYQINVYFLYGVSTLESDWGTSSKARNDRNFYGINLKSAHYDTWDECTEYWCDMINRLYINKGLRSVSDIAPVYCPPRSEHWSQSVTWFMDDLMQGVKTPKSIKSVA